MPEKLVAKATQDTARTAEKGLESLVRKAWTFLDAASEKKTPSQYLTDRGVGSIRGES